MLATLLGVLGSGLILGGAMALGFVFVSKITGMDKYNTRQPRRMENYINGQNLTSQNLVFNPEDKESLKNHYDTLRIIQECIDEDETDTREFDEALKDHKSFVDEYKESLDDPESNSYVKFLDTFVDFAKKTKDKRKKSKKKNSKVVPIQNPSDMVLDDIMSYEEFLETPMGQFYSNISLADGIEADKARFRKYSNENAYPWATLKGKKKGKRKKKRRNEPYEDINIYAT